MNNIITPIPTFILSLCAVNLCHTAASLIQQRDMTVSPEDAVLDAASSSSLPLYSFQKNVLGCLRFSLPHNWREIRVNLTFTKLKRKQYDFHRGEHL